MGSAKAKFIELVNGITREGAKIDGLVEKLNNSDFFIAPASTRFHSSCEEGLVQHSLNVYFILTDIVQSLRKTYGDDIVDYSDETLRIVALFHDISKMNFYKPSVRNVKVYKEDGTKHDEMGSFDWEAQKSFAVRDDNERFIFGTHGENSAQILNFYIPLKYEELSAITNHHGVFDNPKLDFTAIANRYGLVPLLHTADLLATYVIEKC